MSGRTLTEPEAWREIARRIAEGEWRKMGLCYEVVALRIVGGRISEKQCNRMGCRIEQHIAVHEAYATDWAYKPGAEPEARILAALWLALEAEEENA